MQTKQREQEKSACVLQTYNTGGRLSGKPGGLLLLLLLLLALLLLLLLLLLLFPKCAREKRPASCTYDEYEDQDLGYADIQMTTRTQEQVGLIFLLLLLLLILLFLSYAGVNSCKDCHYV